MGASAIHVWCMEEITQDAVREIEQIHSSWIDFEVAGQGQSLIAFCADDIELWPPEALPLIGRSAVSAEMARATTKIHCVEITDRRIRGSNEIAYLTASYKTTFSSAEDPTPRQARGSHLWVLQKQAGTWVISLVSWSVRAP
jgi:ketosteroid isomerase-like protein